MPNRRRIGYMPSRRFDEKKNLEGQKVRRRRLSRDSAIAASDGDVNFEEWTKTCILSRPSGASEDGPL